MTENKITLADFREEALLARMPGRRSFWRRRAPEIWAAAIYLVVLTVWLVPEFVYRPKGGMGAPPRVHGELLAELNLMTGAYLAYFLAGAVLFFGATISGALAWARERDRGTLEPLLLTPMNFSAVVSLRFRHVLWPWARLMLWLLPLYLLIGCGGIILGASHAISRSDAWISCSLSVFAPRSLMIVLLDKHGVGGWGLLQGFLSLLRFANELSAVMFACAVAYFMSVRARSATRAMVAACLLVPVALVAQDLLLVASIIIEATGDYHNVEETILIIYGFAGIAAFIARIWLALWLVKRAARNFDWYALGEKPPEAERAGLTAEDAESR